MLAAKLDHRAALKRDIPNNKELRKQLIPDYNIGCKRVLKSDEYFATVRRDNVEIHSANIDAITSDAIICNGRTIPTDVSPAPPASPMQCRDRLLFVYIFELA